MNYGIEEPKASGGSGTNGLDGWRLKRRVLGAAFGRNQMMARFP